MKFNKWTLALAAGGVLSLGSAAQAEEAQSQVMTALSSTTLSGYIETSANWRVGKTAGAIPGRTFDGGDKQDGFNLHVAKLTLEKPLDDGEWSAGYKLDLVMGPDANYYQTTLNGGGLAKGDFAVKQAYANFRVPAGTGIDVKMGVFDTIIGYEVFESGNNPNYSRSYGYFLEPTHHTGVLASYHITDLVSVSAGIANTAFGAINGRAARAGGYGPADQTEKTYMASVTVTMPDSVGFLAGSTLYAGVINGLSSGDTSTTRKDTTSYYAGYTMNTPLKGLSAGIAFDYRSNGGNGLTPSSNWAWATALYLSYQATEKLKLNSRLDWVNGSDGTLYDSRRQGLSDNQNSLLALTLTADYSLWANLITRLEARWDHSLTGDHVFPSSNTGYYIPEGGFEEFGFGGDQGDRNVFTLAWNVIYKF